MSVPYIKVLKNGFLPGCLPGVATLLLVFLSWPTLRAQVVISEVMFDVQGADYHDEFVELYNCSSEAVDLTGWQFSDSTGTDDLQDAGYGLLLHPGQFAVILDGSYFENSTTYDSIIPPEALILKISDGAFGSGGLANTRPERLTLIDAGGREIDAYRYSVDNSPGYSDEKIILCSAQVEGNWANSLTAGGTPGFKNSVSPRDLDLAFTAEGLTVLPQSMLQKGQIVQVKLRYFNAGTQAFYGQTTFRCFLDLNGNQKLEILEPIVFERQLEVGLDPGQGDSLLFEIRLEMSGELNLIAELLSDLDQNARNNQAMQKLVVMDTQQALVINEIKFLTQEEEPEWIELYNDSDQKILLNNWAIADLKDTLVIDRNLVLPARSYMVVAADSAIFKIYDLPDSVVYVGQGFPHLNNDEDVIFLIPPWGGWVEQAPYTVDWLMGEEYRKPSLERINPQLDARLGRNWAPCVKNGTPGKQNSIFSSVRHTQLKLEAQPNPFSPDGDGHEDFTVLSLQVPAQTARVRVLIFDMLGRQVCSLTENQFSGQDVAIVWDGRDAHKKRMRMGIYIVFAQMIDDANGILQEAKTTVVVAY